MRHEDDETIVAQLHTEEDTLSTTATENRAHVTNSELQDDHWSLDNVALDWGAGASAYSVNEKNTGGSETRDNKVKSNDTLDNNGNIRSRERCACSTCYHSHCLQRGEISAVEKALLLTILVLLLAIVAFIVVLGFFFDDISGQSDVTELSVSGEWNASYPGDILGYLS
ncbi:hypothetical protein V1264_002037 [Littorina saxatilis]|uniref:Uncharacterized protein n=3 Tax=Littorina saxatilis TaxID=31220 RepID=A0AAN9GQH6_9CAEN